MSAPPRPRILMSADAVGGVWTYACDLARALAERGCTVRLVTLSPAPRADQLRALRRAPGVELEMTDLALEWMDPEARDLPRAREALMEIESRFAPDVVHLNGFREATASWRAPVLVVAHSCVRSWSRACRGAEFTEPRWFTYAANVRAGLAAADAWVAPTRAFRDDIDALHAPPRAGRVIHNGVETQPPTSPKEPFILAAGRFWDEAKNLSALADVAGMLPWPVRVAGDAQASVDGRATGAQLEFLGLLAHHELQAQMRRAAIFAAPSLYEPFGLGVLEAAASGCALVLSDIPTFRELWNGAALFVDPRDRASLQAALTRACENHALRRSLQLAAANRARRYTLSSIADVYLQTYEALLRRPGRTGRYEPAFLEQAS